MSKIPGLPFQKTKTLGDREVLKTWNIDRIKEELLKGFVLGNFAEAYTDKSYKKVNKERGKENKSKKKAKWQEEEYVGREK